MDIFDQYLFEELTTQYSKSGLSADDYEELYIRFCNMNHLDEVQPYLMTMRYFGLGTASEKKAVLSELKEKLSEDDCILKGLYYDLLLSENSNNADALVNLRRMVEEGYTNVFTKEKTHIEKAKTPVKDSDSQTSSISTKPERVDEAVVVDYITFECNGYSGLYFAAGEIDYLAAKVYIKPFHGKKHIKVRSQIFLDGETFSKVFSNEYDIDSNTRWFKTQGWGNTNCNCYSSNIYKWIIEIDGEKTYSQTFRMYNGKLEKYGPNVSDVKLFASKHSGALKTDWDNYRTTFSHAELECLYFKFLIAQPGKNMCVQIHKKIVYLEDDSEICNIVSLMELQHNWTDFWTGWGYIEPGKWKKGLYQYLVCIGEGEKFQGTFAVY